MHPGLAYSFFATSQLINKGLASCWNKVVGNEKQASNPANEKESEPQLRKNG